MISEKDLLRTTDLQLNIIEASLARLPPRALAVVLTGYLVTTEMIVQSKKAHVPKEILEYHAEARKLLQL